MGEGRLMSKKRRRSFHGLLALLTTLAVATFPGNGSAETWVDWRAAGPFVCRADFSLDGLEALFNDLAQVQHDLVRWLGILPAKEPIHVYLFGDQWTYRRFLSRHLPDVSYRRALYVKSGGVGMVFAYRSSQLAIDLRHECTHALLHASLPMVPLWLDEGLAEYFEAAPGQRVFDNPYLSRVRWSARLGIVPSLEKLESLGDLSEMGGTEYCSAWAWTHFALHGPREAHDELVRFLADIEAHSPPGLLSRRLERRMPDLRHRFATHFRNWKR
jgi:hypothetical protein